MRAYIHSLLEDEYRIVESVDGADALEQAVALVPDLVLSDVMMPEMDGYALSRAIKDDPRISHVPVVLLTARADTESRIEGFEQGADAYLPKPFNAEELRVRVRGLIEQRRSLREKFAGVRALRNRGKFARREFWRERAGRGGWNEQPAASP